MNNEQQTTATTLANVAQLAVSILMKNDGTGYKIPEIYTDTNALSNFCLQEVKRVLKEKGVYA